MPKPKTQLERAERLSASVHELLARAQAGDRTATSRLREFLETRPDVWGVLGDLAQQAQLSAIALVTSGNAVLNEAVTRTLTGLRAELAGTMPSVLERLLVERILVSWVFVHHADIVAARHTDVRLAQAEYYQRRQERAQRRYLAAIRALACVRRLGVQLLEGFEEQPANVRQRAERPN